MLLLLFFFSVAVAIGAAVAVVELLFILKEKVVRKTDLSKNMFVLCRR